MADEHASIPASKLVARSQRSDGVSAALADKQRASNVPTDRIQAGRRDLSVTYDFDMSLPSLESPGRLLFCQRQNFCSISIERWPLPRLASRVRPKFHHPTGLKTIDLLWITLFPLGCGFQAKGHLRTAVFHASKPAERIAALLGKSLQVSWRCTRCTCIVASW
jgi:hypothetical protein